MARKFIAASAALALLISTSALAQDDSGAPAATGTAVTAPPQPDQTSTPGAPAPESDGGPVAAGGPAGIAAASAWAAQPDRARGRRCSRSGDRLPGRVWRQLYLQHYEDNEVAGPDVLSRRSAHARVATGRAPRV